MGKGYGEPRGNEYGSDDNRDRWRDDDRARSDWRSGEPVRGREDDRGFLERAGDEIRSWFGDEDDRGPGSHDRGRFGEEWSGRSSWNRDDDANPRGTGGGPSWDRDRNRGGMPDRDRQPNYGRTASSGYMVQGRDSFGGRDRTGLGHSGRSSSFDSGRSGLSSHDESRRRFGYAGDRSWERGGHPQSWSEANRGESRQRGRGQSEFDRDLGLGDPHLGFGDFSGTLGGFGNQTFGSSQDDHYRSWRDRQMSELDRDYSDYCREREQQFHSDFDSWRRNRPKPAASNSGPDLGSSSNAGVGTTTASTTGSAGAGSAIGSATGTGGSIQADTTASTETAGTETSRPGARSRS